MLSSVAAAPAGHLFAHPGGVLRPSAVAPTPASSAHRSATATAAMGSHHAEAPASSGGLSLHPHVGAVLYSEEVIAARVRQLATELSAEYKDKNPVVLQVLCGAFMFAADLCRYMDVPNMQVDCVRASSYGAGTESSGTVTLSGLTTDVRGRHVVLVEDIVDTGLTIAKLKTHLTGLGASTVTVVTLLNKAARRKNAMVPDWVGFECPDEFVIGYGLDYDGKYRQLAYIGVLRPEFI